MIIVAGTIDEFSEDIVNLTSEIDNLVGDFADFGK